MRTVLIASLLLGAGLIAMAPSASAQCTVSDPTGLTWTCIGEHSAGSTDPECQTQGAHYGFTGATIIVPGVGGASAFGESRCANQSWGTHDSQFIVVSAGAMGTSVTAHYSEWDTNGQGGCQVGARTFDPVLGPQDPFVECPPDTVPRIPFGNLL